MMVICHSKRLESSTKPAENPSTGLLVSSAQHSQGKSLLAELHKSS